MPHNQSAEGSDLPLCPVIWIRIGCY